MSMNLQDTSRGGWSLGHPEFRPGRPGSHHLPESEEDRPGVRLGVSLFRLGFHWL